MGRATGTVSGVPPCGGPSNWNSSRRGALSAPAASPSEGVSRADPAGGVMPGRANGFCRARGRRGFPLAQRVDPRRLRIDYRLGVLDLVLELFACRRRFSSSSRRLVVSMSSSRDSISPSRVSDSRTQPASASPGAASSASIPASAGALPPLPAPIQIANSTATDPGHGQEQQPLASSESFACGRRRRSRPAPLRAPILDDHGEPLAVRTALRRATARPPRRAAPRDTRQRGRIPARHRRRSGTPARCTGARATPPPASPPAADR